MGVQKSVQFDDEEYIEKFKEDNQLASFSSAVNMIIREHRTKQIRANISETFDILASYCKGIEFKDDINMSQK